MMLRASWGRLEASNALCQGKKVSWRVPDAFGIAQPTAGKPSIPFSVPHSNVEPGLAPEPSSVSHPYNTVPPQHHTQGCLLPPCKGKQMVKRMTH